MLNDTRMQSAKCGMQGQITHFLQQIHCKEKKGVNLCNKRQRYIKDLSTKCNV